MKKIANYMITFLLLIIGFNILLFVISLFPSSLLKEQVKESSEILVKEGNRYLMSNIFMIYNNNYTDSIILNEAYSIDNKNPFVSYMKARKNYNRDITQEELKDVNGELKSIGIDGHNFSEEYNPVR